MAEEDIQLKSLEALISANYEPAHSLEDADLKISTLDLLEKFAESFPGAYLDSDSLFTLMHKLNFTLVDYGEMNFVWILKERSIVL